MHPIHTLRAFVLATLLCVSCAFAPACAHWQTLKPIIRTIADIALAACHAHAAANPGQLGPLTPEQWCEVGDNFAPFLEAQREASLRAQNALGLSAAPSMAGD